MNVKIKHFARKHPMIGLIFISIILGFLMAFMWAAGNLIGGTSSPMQLLVEIVLVGGMCGIGMGLTCILPILLTILEIWALIQETKGKEISIEIRHVDILTIILGVLYNVAMLSCLDSVMFKSDWHVTLYNNQKHTPIFTETYLTIWVIIFVAVAGYLLVSLIPLEKMPPLALVIGFSAMYLGTLESILWTVQVFKGEDLPEILLLLLPVCCVCITARTVLHKVGEWNRRENIEENAEINADENTDTDVETSNIHNKTFFWWCNRILSNSKHWPIAAFIIMWPLLGIIIGILILFGQKPDAVIKAWTETSDWNLSRRIAPQNIYYDEHYLCTVAAGGHENVVKPLRLGVRHGHEVIVNRQLCVANAFEQILEEKTPHFHKVVRGFYDTYGFPIAKLIKSKTMADVIYILMKPLEWMFLIILYLVDVNPENRIAVQYTGKKVQDILQSAR